MLISDLSSDVCSFDLHDLAEERLDGQRGIRLLGDDFVEQIELPVKIGGHLLEDFESELNKVESRRMSYIQKMAAEIGRASGSDREGQKVEHTGVDVDNTKKEQGTNKRESINTT